MKPYCVCFAGAVGSSKTPIAHYLSLKFGLPIHNNDAIRTEIVEDFGSFRDDEYALRRDERMKELLRSQRPFILDASIDRSWVKAKEGLSEAGYDFFVISMDLSKSFLDSLHDWKAYEASRKELDRYIRDHAKFLAEFPDDVALHIADKDFPERLKISHAALQKWLEKTAQ